MRVVIIVSILLFAVLSFAQDEIPCWIYVQTEDQLNYDPACEYCDLETSCQAGEVVEILRDRPQDQPTNTESTHWAICQVDLTEAEISMLKEIMYEVANPEPTETPISWLSLFSTNLYAQEIADLRVVAFRKYRLTDLEELGLDTVGIKTVNWNTEIAKESDETKKNKLKKDKDDFKMKFKSKIKEKKKKDIDDWKQKKKDKNK